MLAAVAFLVACTSAQIVTERDAGADTNFDGGPDTAVPDGGCAPGVQVTGEPAGCVLDRWPPRPNCAPDEGDVGVIELALLEPRLRPSPEQIGFDQDRVCSGAAGNPPSCMGTMQPDVSPGGIDNSMSSEILPTVVLAVPNFEDLFIQGVAEGRGTPLLRIEGWNGEDDDAQVVATMAGAAVVPPAPLPLWDGTDVVPVADSFFAAGLPTLQDTSAYVADGMLVMKWPDNQSLAFEAGGTTVRIRFRNARMVAEIDLEADPIVRNATIFGRWLAADGIADLDLLGICEDSPDPRVQMLRTMAVLLLDGAVDLAADEDDDMVGGTAPCVAISFAMHLQTSARVMWGPEAPAVILTPCDGT